MFGIYQLIKKICSECDYRGTKSDVWQHMLVEHPSLAYKIKRKATRNMTLPDSKLPPPEEYVYSKRIKLGLKEKFIAVRRDEGPFPCPTCGETVTNLGVGFGEYYAEGPDNKEYVLGYDVDGCNREIFVLEETTKEE